jgi:hypothetical protein
LASCYVSPGWTINSFHGMWFICISGVYAIYTYNSQPFDKKLYTQTTYLLVSEEGEAKQDDLTKEYKSHRPFSYFKLNACVAEFIASRHLSTLSPLLPHTLSPSDDILSAPYLYRSRVRVLYTANFCLAPPVFHDQWKSSCWFNVALPYFLLPLVVPREKLWPFN